MGMNAQDRKLLIEIHGDVRGMKPVVEATAGAVRRMDDRVRALEIQQGEQQADLARAKQDIVGLWRSVRARQEHAGTGRGVWVAALEMITALPDYWHALLVVGSLVAGATAGLAMALHAAGR